MGFVHGATVRFSQVDAAGIIYFSRMFEMCHDAYEGWMAAAGMPLGSELSAQGWLLPLVHADADYVAPCRLGDELSIHVAVERVGTSSITLRFRVAGADGGHRATVRHVHTTIDAASFATRPLPEALRSWAVHAIEESS